SDDAPDESVTEVAKQYPDTPQAPLGMLVVSPPPAAKFPTFAPPPAPAASPGAPDRTVLGKNASAGNVEAMPDGAAPPPAPQEPAASFAAPRYAVERP